MNNEFNPVGSYLYTYKDRHVTYIHMPRHGYAYTCHVECMRTILIASINARARLAVYFLPLEITSYV